MRLEQLEYLAAVSRHGSLRRAGEELHISQPALSEAITKLERELGATLLDRHRSGARVTSRGRELLDPMVAVLDAVDRLRVAARGAPADECVRIAVSGPAATAAVIPALDTVRARHPQVRIELMPTPVDADLALHDGALDLALLDVPIDQQPVSGLVDTSLRAGVEMVVLPTAHRLSRHDVVSTALLADEPFIRVGPRDAPSWLTPGNRSHQADRVETALELVGAGLGIALIASYDVPSGASAPDAARPDIVARPLAGAAPGVTLTVRRRRSATSPALTTIVTTLGRGCGASPPPR